MAYATAQDVEIRWGRTPTDAEEALIDTRLDDVERMILKRVPNLDDWVADGTVSRDDVVRVEAEVVLRLVRNPEGYVSESDGNYTYQLNRNLSHGQLSILPEEWALLGLRFNQMSVLIPTPVMPKVGTSEMWRNGNIWPGQYW